MRVNGSACCETGAFYRYLAGITQSDYSEGFVKVTCRGDGPTDL